MSDLQVKDLVVEYSSGGYAVRPIDGLDLDVPTGSLAILLGPSGCGKTTLLSCLGGILRPSAGCIEFGDIDVTELDRAGLSAYRRDTVGIVFQAFNLVPSLSALENVMVPLRAAGRSRQQARQRAEELLARVGLADRMRHRPGDLSGGQQQWVAVARAIALDPPLLLADEPTTWTSSRWRRCCGSSASSPTTGWWWLPRMTPGCCRWPTGWSNWWPVSPRPSVHPKPSR
jgi:putative ABC transport system ATP-binding protein